MLSHWVLATKLEAASLYSQQSRLANTQYCTTRVMLHPVWKPSHAELEWCISPQRCLAGCRYPLPLSPDSQAQPTYLASPNPLSHSLSLFPMLVFHSFHSFPCPSLLPTGFKLSSFLTPPMLLGRKVGQERQGWRYHWEERSHMFHVLSSDAGTWQNLQWLRATARKVPLCSRLDHSQCKSLQSMCDPQVFRTLIWPKWEIFIGIVNTWQWPSHCQIWSPSSQDASTKDCQINGWLILFNMRKTLYFPYSYSQKWPDHLICLKNIQPHTDTKHGKILDQMAEVWHSYKWLKTGFIMESAIFLNSSITRSNHL